jgi:hypothetical protein
MDSPGGAAYTFEYDTDKATRQQVGPTYAQRTFSGQYGRDQGKAIADMGETVRKADLTLPYLKEAQAMLPTMFSGSLADTQLALAKFANFLGVSPESLKLAATNSELFYSIMGQRVLSVVQELGTAQSITDADVQFSKDIVGQNRQLEPKTIKRLLEIAIEGTERLKQQYGQMSGQAAQVPGMGTVPAYQSGNSAGSPSQENRSSRFKIGQTMTNPKTGEVIIWTGTAWEPKK